MSNPIKYTSRDFITVLNDINSDPNLEDKPEWFKRLIAGLADICSMWLNAQANESYLDTAFTRRANQSLLRLIGYELSSQTTSSGTLIYHLKETVSFPITFSAAELTALSQGSSVVSSKVFKPIVPITVTATTGNFTWSGANNILTVSTNFLYTGHKLRLTTTGTLPTGLAINTDYYIIWISATQIKLASSIANAFSNTPLPITSAGTGTHTWNLYSFAVTAYQREEKSEQIIGQTDGVTPWQEFNLPDKNILSDTVNVSVGTDAYTNVSTFVNSLPTDKHFAAILKSENQLAIYFGNGTYGIQPPANDVKVVYALGGGTLSNISNLNKITIYSGGNSDIVSCTNPVIFSGGSEEESIASAKVIAPLLLKSRDRFITPEDGEVLVYNYGGISLVSVIPNFYGTLSAKVVGIATGGGNPSTILKSSIQTELIEKSVLSSMDVRFVDCTLTTVVVISAAKLKPGYSWSNVQPYLLLAWKLFFSETGKEIYDKYLDVGITGTIVLINTIFSTSFTSADNAQIIKIVSNLEHRNFNDTIQISDAYSYIQTNVIGIDYITISSPSFPIVLGVSEITTHTGSTFTLTQIV